MAKSSPATKSTASKKTAAKKAAPKKVAAKKATTARATTSAQTKDRPTRANKAARTGKFKKVSRAVTRLVEPGSQVDCMHCGERVKFQAKMRHQQVICNVYEKHEWLRVDHYHANCYEEAKQPYGKPVD